MKVKVIGAGLSGSEAAWQIAKRGIEVELYEMRPVVSTPAHKTDLFAELVCSNSFRGADLTNAVGLLKQELLLLDSLIMNCAIATQVPAGGAMAVDRLRFSQLVSEKINSHPNIKVIKEEITEVPDLETPVIIATGPLTSKKLSAWIEKLLGAQHLAFFDAISPIILGETIDLNKVFRQSRYDKGSGSDYLNIPFNQEQYLSFVHAVNQAEKYTGNELVENDSLERLRPFEGCMPIEDMIERGEQTLRFGPFKPVGLKDPNTDEQPYAVMQLRQDDQEGNLWSMVGMQTRMKRHEQESIFHSLPGLEQAEFVRFGSVHRNTFIESPKCLNASLQLKNKPMLIFAGQITGVEGYVESTASGLLAGINAGRLAQGLECIQFSADTAIGALMKYISTERKDFQPMNISYGLIEYYHQHEFKRRTNKKDRRLLTAKNAMEMITQYKLEFSL